LFNNTINAYDNGTNNAWNISNSTGPNIAGGPYIGGNYYSDYTGSDGDGDGFGDTPYTISGPSASQDQLPLIRESNSPSVTVSANPTSVRVGGSVNITATITDESSVYLVYFEQDGTNHTPTGHSDNLYWWTGASTSSTGTKHVRVWAYDLFDNVGSGNVSYTVTSAGGGGRGRGGAAPSAPVTLVGENVEASKVWYFDVLSLENPGIITFEYPFVLTKIIIEVYGYVNGVKLTTIQFEHMPSSYEPLPVIAFKYFNITAENLPKSQIKRITFEFKASKSWISLNEVDSSTISMYHFGNEWIALNTTKIGEDGSYIYFRAIGYSFSPFAIGGKSKVAVPTPYCGDGICQATESCYTCPADCGVCPPVCGNGICEEGENEENCPEDCKVKAPFPIFPFIIILALVFGGLLYYWYHKKKLAGVEKPPKPAVYREKALKNYVSKVYKMGYRPQTIKKILLKKGWKEYEINDAFREVGIIPETFEKPPEVPKKAMTPEAKIKLLANYIREMLKEGYSARRIKRAILNTRWTKYEMDQAFRIATTPPEKEEELEEYIEKMLSMGFSKWQIRRRLVLEGWDRKLVDYLLRLIK